MMHVHVDGKTDMGWSVKLKARVSNRTEGLFLLPFCCSHGQGVSRMDTRFTPPQFFFFTTRAADLAKLPADRKGRVAV